jgi:hypothetical protein
LCGPFRPRRFPYYGVTVYAACTLRENKEHLLLICFRIWIQAQKSPKKTNFLFNSGKATLLFDVQLRCQLIPVPDSPTRYERRTIETEGFDVKSPHLGQGNQAMIYCLDEMQ